MSEVQEVKTATVEETETGVTLSLTAPELVEGSEVRISPDFRRTFTEPDPEVLELFEVHQRSPLFEVPQKFPATGMIQIARRTFGS